MQSSSTSYRNRIVSTTPLSSKVERLVNDAKRRHRSDLKVERWGKDGFAGSDVCDLAVPQTYAIAREQASELSVKKFIKRYEREELPVVIEGIPEDENWKAVKNWTFKELRRQFKHTELKCGEDDNGKNIRMKLKYFLKYVKSQTDDSPLYIFDSSFDDRKETTPLLSDYSVPKYFPDDLFELVGEKRRPPYRWFLIGPKRSGTTVHIDPLGTSAWNTVLVGRKRWVLFPPETSRVLAKGKDFVFKGEDDEAVNYFADILPRIKQKHPELKVYEFIQYPGETVFVPGGWWHGVFNLDDTIAITQNFCSKTNFSRVWKKTRSGRKRMAVKWLERLEHQYPKLHAQALELNAEDNYQMYQKKNKRSSSSEPVAEPSTKKKKHKTK